MNIKYILILIFTTFLFSNSSGLRIRGSFDTPKVWKYLGRFGFNKGGYIELNSFWSTTDSTKIVLYSDKNPYIDGILKGDSNDNCYTKVNKGDYIFTLKSPHMIYNISQQRQRYWYFAIADCDPNIIQPFDHLDCEYDLTLNNPGKNIFETNISSDQKSIPITHIVFLGIYFILCAFIIGIIAKLKSKQLNFKQMLLLLLTMLFYIVSLSLSVVNWFSILHNNGYELKFASILSNGNGIFILLILQLGQGWVLVSNYHLIHPIRRIVNYIVCIVEVFLSVFIFIFYIYKKPEYDSDIYFYDTIPGYILLGVYIIIIFYFIIGNIYAHVRLRTNLDSNNAQLKKFIIIFTIIYSLWLISNPAIVLVAHFMDPWIKYKIIVILNLSIVTIFIIILMVMFLPVKGNLAIKLLKNQRDSIYFNQNRMNNLY
ncbi:hypothetical protein DICPUDRAFT_80123 [Dictyostelium purpureum]|uniref:GPR180/TMEM145 transmembrane domain-containing protein n=1 Tax=Dictyostelium purpureum TaxID=5786 RepID=F0ZPL6_DICPU|nr:uncharacterized protein DICPUDRAFT_80123 [Dictyostelium purpureum]EGC34108.1 hypothetical protein DICPUDRAFT_80123 [Dictyostelium purpureum]|eukprot:XP_003289354.1 hypothetical protein DICPUDRAFT_80123 [Dictyostelium purpureum]